MPAWTTYRGLTIPDSTTGDAGGYLKDDLTVLSDRDRLLPPVKVVALSNVASLSGAQTIGGVSLVADDRVLLIAQSTATENGPWVVQSGAWTRPDDTPDDAHIAGALIFSQNGVSGQYAANSAWLCTNSADSDVVGTDNLTFARVTGLALASANSPLSISNDTLSLSGVIPVTNGGTGSSTALSNNRIIVSSGGSYSEAAALTNGQLLIGSTGAAPVAASLTGTTNQITVTGGAGSITLALPQNIHTAATPTFGGLTLTGAATVTSVAASSLTTSGTITATGAISSSSTISATGAGSFGGLTLTGAATMTTISATSLTASSTVSATGAISSSSTITASGLGTFAGVTVSGSNVLTLPTGSSGAPSLTFSGDTDTGIFRPAAGTIALSTDGTVALTAVGGKVGVGGTPSTDLHVARSPSSRVAVEGVGGSGENNPGYELRTNGTFKGGLFYAEGADRVTIWAASQAGFIASDGGLAWGNPTGGSKGAGTINCQNVYVNGGAVPDYVFDLAFDGRICCERDLDERIDPEFPNRTELLWRGTGQPATADELADYRRRTGQPILSVEELDRFVRARRHLPTLSSREERHAKGASSIADLLREQHETIEHLSLYILELHRRLSHLERVVTDASPSN